MAGLSNLHNYTTTFIVFFFSIAGTAYAVHDYPFWWCFFACNILYMSL